MKKLLIRLLFKLIGSPLDLENTIEEKRMSKWLAVQYPLTEFRGYIKKRDLEVLQVMGNIATRENYLIHIGQRIEICRLLTLAKENYEMYAKQQETKKVKSTRK